MAFRLPGDSPKLNAAEINRWNQLADQRARGELKIRSEVPNTKNYDRNSRVALCKNTSGSDRSAFDCMSIGGMLWTLETDGTSDVIFTLGTADPDSPPAILVEPIADGEFGRAVVDGLALANVDTAVSATHLMASPQASGHNLLPAENGSVRLLTAPSIGGATLLVVSIGQPMRGIIDIRLSGLNLQYTVDGTNWTTWHTADDTCPP